MTIPLEAPIDENPDASAVVEVDVRCRQCGYNLRALRVDGRCPECGTAVAYSVKGDFIRYSNPAWTAGLRMGINLMLAGIVTIILIVIASIVLGINRAGVGITTATTMVGTFISQGLLFFGTWKLTEPDPSGLGEDAYGRVRRFIRLALLINLAGTIVAFVPAYAPVPTPYLRMLTLVTGLATLVGLTGFVCQLIYLSRLALRIPDEVMARRARSLASSIGISYGVVLLGGIFIKFMTPAGGGTAFPTPLITTLSLVLFGFSLWLLINGLRYLLLIEKFGKRLKSEEMSARTSWALA